MMEQFL